MAIDVDAALERALSEGDEWASWRALRLAGDEPGPLPIRPCRMQREGGSARAVVSRRVRPERPSVI